MLIASILDQDLYAFTQQQIIRVLYKNTPVSYRFINRRASDTFDQGLVDKIEDEVNNMVHLQLSEDELSYLRALNLFRDDYLNYLKNYRFDPSQVCISLDDQNELQLSIKGDWAETILWETPLLAIITSNWCNYRSNNERINREVTDHIETLKEKRKILDAMPFVEFGTRRRRSLSFQEIAIDKLRRSSGFIGTSNDHFAKQFNLKPVGTMSHQYIMGTSAIHGVNGANSEALNHWITFYEGRLGVALTDTFTSEVFFREFDWKLAKLYDGLRWDSGDPYAFTDKAIQHYESLGIDPKSKTIYYSDGLSPEKCVEILTNARANIRKVFCIGTNLTNDVVGSQAPSFVIKLTECAEVPVVKLSDDLGKATGKVDEIEFVRRILNV